MKSSKSSVIGLALLMGLNQLHASTDKLDTPSSVSNASQSEEAALKEKGKSKEKPRMKDVGVAVREKTKGKHPGQFGSYARQLLGKEATDSK